MMFSDSFGPGRLEGGFLKTTMSIGQRAGEIIHSTATMIIGKRAGEVFSFSLSFCYPAISRGIVRCDRVVPLARPLGTIDFRRGHSHSFSGAFAP